MSTQELLVLARDCGLHFREWDPPSLQATQDPEDPWIVTWWHYAGTGSSPEGALLSLKGWLAAHRGTLSRVLGVSGDDLSNPKRTPLTGRPHEYSNGVFRDAEGRLVYVDWEYVPPLDSEEVAPPEPSL